VALWFKIFFEAIRMTMSRLLSRLSFPVFLTTMMLAMFSVSSQTQTSSATGKAIFSGDANAKACTFPFEWREGLIFLPVRINGSKPLSFALDTGSTRILIDRKLAIDLGLKASGTGSMQGAGAGRIPIEFIHDVNIALPGMESGGYDLSTADLQPLEADDGGKVDGIIGYPLLSRFVITVDFEARKLTLTEAFHPNSTAQALPIELRDKWPFVKGEIVLPGPVTVQDSFLIDSGSSDAVDHPIVMTLQSRVPSKSGVGLGSEVQGATARAASFHLGRYTIESPLVACCGGTDATSKLIGNEILRRFTVTFDYPSSRILLTPNSHYADTQVLASK
jgi:Aspartyl protease